MPVLGGSYPEVCFAKYGAMPVRGKYVHEMALRTLLHAVDTCANKYGRHVVPWLSLSVDFYVRVFVRVYDSPAEVKRSCLRRVMLHQSVQCPSFYVQPLGQVKAGKGGGESYSSAYAEAPTTCPETGGRMRVGGPFWGAPLHDPAVVAALLRYETFFIVLLLFVLTVFVWWQAGGGDGRAVAVPRPHVAPGHRGIDGRGGGTPRRAFFLPPAGTRFGGQIQGM